MKRSFIIAVIMFIILLIVSSCAFSKKQNNSKNMIVGFWSTTFPVPSALYGYAFFPDNKFLYFDERSFNIKGRYSGSMGKWKIERNKIYILPQKDYFWKDNWAVDQNTGQLDPGDSNYRYVADSINTWEIIGDIRSYTEDKFYIENNKKVFLKPANIFIKSLLFFNGKILSYNYSESSYWKLFNNPLDDPSIKKIFEEFNKLSN
jgi:hypothetical protein